MTAIYEPRGAAREYCERAVNLYRGCGHGCAYCYAPGVLRMKRPDFHETVKLRDGILKAIGRDAPKHAGREVLLCFTCDPYGPGTDPEITDQAIRLLQNGGCRVNVLTKAGWDSDSALGILRPGIDRYGTTLTFVSRRKSGEWEPSAAAPGERVIMLKRAKLRGIETWASIEPVIEPAESLACIDTAMSVVDTFKLGKWNHDQRARHVDWAGYGRMAVALCKAGSADYMIKRDLAEAMGLRDGEF